MTLLNLLNSLPDSYKPALITSSTAILGAFIGAFVAQYLSHKLTLKRDRLKHLGEIYYKLFSPIIFEIYSYIDIRTHYRRGHDINPDVNENLIFSQIFNHVESNLMYASPKLKKSFHEVKKSTYSYDGSGFITQQLDLLFLLAILEDLHSLESVLKMYDEENINELINNKIYLIIWTLILHISSDESEALEVIKHKWLLDDATLNERNYRLIKKHYGFCILNEQVNKKNTFSASNFIQFIKNELIIKQKDKEMFDEIIKNNIEVID